MKQRFRKVRFSKKDTKEEFNQKCRHNEFVRLSRLSMGAWIWNKILCPEEHSKYLKRMKELNVYEIEHKCSYSGLIEW